MKIGGIAGFVMGAIVGAAVTASASTFAYTSMTDVLEGAPAQQRAYVAGVNDTAAMVRSAISRNAERGVKQVMTEADCLVSKRVTIGVLTEWSLEQLQTFMPDDQKQYSAAAGIMYRACEQ
jgi:hypothetical protein